MRHKKICKAPPGWPARAKISTRKAELGLLLLVLSLLLVTTTVWAGTQPVEKEQYLTTSNRAPDGMVINRIARPPKPVYSLDLLSAKKPSNWEQILPLAKRALTPYNLDWHSINGGGQSFGTSATRHLGYSVGQSVSGSGSSASNDLCIGFWCGTGPACVVTCPPGGVAEGEACIPDTVDHFNGGCNYVPEAYSPINCGDTICGTAWADTVVGLNYRDTDWYLHRFTSDTIVTWKVVAEFPPAIFILDLTGGCAGLSILGFASGNACDTVQLTADLSSGDYVFFIATNAFDGFACVDGPHDYVAILDCVPNCAQCPPGGIAEGEPCSETDDTFNGGCNSAPPVYSSINIGDTVCGTAFINDTLRDTDWYEKVLTESTVVRWCAVAEFPVVLFTLDGTSGCGGLTIRKSAAADSCDTASIVDTLPPGTYWFFAAPDFAAFGQNFCVDGPHKYTAWLVPACSRARGDLNGNTLLDPSDVVLLLLCVFAGTGDCDLCFADINCNEALDPSDIVFELLSVFAGNPLPTCP